MDKIKILIFQIVDEFKKFIFKKYNSFSRNKCKQSITKRKKTLFNYIILLIIIVLFKELKFSYIELTIPGPGLSKILYKNEGGNIYCPITSLQDEITINDIPQIEKRYEYDFNKTENIVRLIYVRKLTNLNCMFYSCSNITKIDFTHFYSSSVEQMGSTFNGCTSLIAINFSNFDASNVERMQLLFYNCKSLQSINLSNINASKLINTTYMFGSCVQLKSIDFTSFITYELKDMMYMFYNCRKLISLNLSSFETHKVSHIYNLFENCESLISVDLSSFKATNMISMPFMFHNCISLVSVDLSNFITTNRLEYIGSMFKNCTSLEYVNLNNFNTVIVKHMDFMFYNCISLKSINLSNFDTSKVTWIESMFDGCIKLEYINLMKAIEITEKPLNYRNIFRGVPENIVICLNETNAPNLSLLIKNKTCHSFDCSNDYIQNQKKMINDRDKCIYSCNDILDYVYEYEDKCIFSCYCKSCKENYYPKENDTLYKNLFFNCYQNPEGYYLDKDEFDNPIYKLCNKKCQTCIMKGNALEHNCITCKDKYPFGIINDNNQINCYINCSCFYYFDEDKNYQCTKDYFCPKEFSKLQPERRECIKDCSLETNTKFEFQKTCYERCPPQTEESLEKAYYCEAICDEENPFELIDSQKCVDYCDINDILTGLCIMKYEVNNNIKGSDETDKKEKDLKEEEIKIQDKILANIEKSFTSNNFNTSSLEKGNNIVIEEKKMTIILTTTDNQNNKQKDNITNIDFGGCETILRNIYIISNEKKLFMKKIEVKQEGLKIPKIEYDVYCNLNGINLTKLNLTYCKNTKVDLFMPVKISESIDILNSSSGYYKDICYTATSGVGTDISLNDRKKEFMNNNKTLCQENCDFSDYNYEIQKAKCSCKVKESSVSSALMNINTTEIFNNFMDVKNYVNIVMLRCYKVLFSKNGIAKNIEFYFNIPIIILHLICIIIFYREQLNKIKEIIQKIIYGIKNWYLVRNEEKRKKKEEKGIRKK